MPWHSAWVGGIQTAKRVPAAMPPETAGTQRADRDGVSVTRLFADTEGPRCGTRCWVADEGVSERSERGRASDERPRTRLAKQEPSCSDQQGAGREHEGQGNRLPRELPTNVGQKEMKRT
jgi:hypothetical protein